MVESRSSAIFWEKILDRKIPNAIAGAGKVDQGASTTYVSEVSVTQSGCFTKSLNYFLSNK
jgi:hypothetical protein